MSATRSNGPPEQPKHPAKSTGDWFGHFAAKASSWVGSRWAFSAAIALILFWGITGPIYHYSDTWQLVINTGTTIVTFLMVFLIQNTQNRDGKAVNLKLNELIHAVHDAHNNMIDIESLSDAELDELTTKYEKIREQWEARRGPKLAKK